MLKKIKDNLSSGIDRIKWFSTVFSERVRVEFSVLKLLSDGEKKEKERAEKLKVIGERVFEFRGQTDKNLFKDKVIMETIAELEKVDAEIKGIKKKASEISRLEG